MTVQTVVFKRANALVEVNSAGQPTGKVKLDMGDGYGVQAFSFSATNIDVGVIRSEVGLGTTFGANTLVAVPVLVQVSAGTGMEAGTQLTSPITVKVIKSTGEIKNEVWS